MTIVWIYMTMMEQTVKFDNVVFLIAQGQNITLEENVLEHY